MNAGDVSPPAPDPRFIRVSSPPVNPLPVRLLLFVCFLAAALLAVSVPRAIRLGPLVAENRILTEELRSQLTGYEQFEEDFNRWEGQLKQFDSLFQSRCVQPAADAVPRVVVPPVEGTADVLMARLPAVVRRLSDKPGHDGRSVQDVIDEIEQSLGKVRAAPSRDPVPGNFVTSDFGRRRDPLDGRVAHHGGVDIDGAYGEPVMATAPGRVIEADWHEGYGKRVQLEHGYGMGTVYAHLQDLDVNEGDWVLIGQQIGTVGSTGQSTGSHLHYEVWEYGRARDPLPFLSGD